MILNNCNLFELAEKQLINEVEAEKRSRYNFLNILDYAVIIRKQLDIYGKKGEIIKLRNIHSKKIIKLETEKETRRRLYLNYVVKLT